MIKLFCTDLDGTLFYLPDSEMAGITEENMLAMQKLKDHHIHLMTATGRHHTFLPRVLNDTSLHFDTVGFCGAEVFFDNQVLFAMAFEPNELTALARHLESTSLEAGLHFTTLENDWVHHNVNSPMFQRFRSIPKNGLPKDCRTLFEINIYEYLSVQRTSPIIRVSFWFPDFNDLESYRKLLLAAFPNQYTIVQSSPRELQLMKDGMHKGKGIAMVAEKMNIGIDEIAVIGDSDNDIGMFEYVPCSFCMSHAAPELQAKAKYTVDSFAQSVEMVIEMNEREN